MRQGYHTGARVQDDKLLPAPLSNTSAILYVLYMFGTSLTPNPLETVITFATFGHPDTRE